jgi:DNA polymerase-1
MPDYSQVEVIIFADMYNVESMLEAVRAGVDIHEATAERIWGGKDNELGIIAAMDIIGTTDHVLVNSELHKYNYKITKLESAYGKKNYRKLAKTVTFCKTYGGGPRVLMSWLGIDMTTAKHLMKVYDQAFPDMQEAMALVEAKGKEDGYVMTPFGTRLAVDPWAVYKIINHTIQHSAALLLKRGMRRCVNYLDELDIGARLALTVHDENIFEFRNETATKERLDKLSEIMSDHGGMFSVPTPVDMDYAPIRWSEKEKLAA